MIPMQVESHSHAAISSTQLFSMHSVAPEEARQSRQDRVSRIIIFIYYHQNQK